MKFQLATLAAAALLATNVSAQQYQQRQDSRWQPSLRRGVQTSDELPNPLPTDGFAPSPSFAQSFPYGLYGRNDADEGSQQTSEGILQDQSTEGAEGSAQDSAAGLGGENNDLLATAAASTQPTSQNNEALKAACLKKNQHFNPKCLVQSFEGCVQIPGEGAKTNGCFNPPPSAPTPPAVETQQPWMGRAPDNNGQTSMGGSVPHPPSDSYSGAPSNSPTGSLFSDIPPSPPQDSGRGVSSRLFPDAKGSPSSLPTGDSYRRAPSFQSGSFFPAAKGSFPNSYRGVPSPPSSGNPSETQSGGFDQYQRNF